MPLWKKKKPKKKPPQKPKPKPETALTAPKPFVPYTPPFASPEKGYALQLDKSHFYPKESTTPKPKFDPEREFLKIFKTLTYRYRAWDVWNDFIVMTACSLSNPVDKTHYEEREARYLRIIKKYNKPDRQKFPTLFAQTFMALELNPEQDFLGKLYTMLGLCDDGRKQHFTPYSVCAMMAKITLEDIVDQVRRDGFVTINDPCCGAGATLIASANVAKEALAKASLNFQYHILISAQDIDETVALMCYIQLSLLGVAAYIKIDNTLTNPMSPTDTLENYWFTPMYFSDVWSMRRAVHKLDKLIRDNHPADN